MSIGRRDFLKLTIGVLGVAGTSGLVMGLRKVLEQPSIPSPTSLPNYDATVQAMKDQELQNVQGTAIAQEDPKIKDIEMEKVSPVIIDRQAQFTTFINGSAFPDIFSGLILYSQNDVFLTLTTGHCVDTLNFLSQSKVIDVIGIKKHSFNTNEASGIFPYFVDIVLFRDPERDIGIFAARTKPETPLTGFQILPNLTTKNPKVDPNYHFNEGDRFSTITYPPINLDGTFSPEVVSTFEFYKGNSDGQLEFYGDAQPGLSGIAIASEEGDVVAVYNASILSPMNPSFVNHTFVPVGDILAKFADFSRQNGDGEIAEIAKSLIK